MPGVKDTAKEICCSVFIMDGVEKKNEVVKEVLGEVETEVIGKPERKKPLVPCDQSNLDLTIRFLKVALAASRGGFRKRGVLSHLSVWDPTQV